MRNAKNTLIVIIILFVWIGGAGGMREGMKKADPNLQGWDVAALWPVVIAGWYVRDFTIEHLPSQKRSRS